MIGHIIQGVIGAIDLLIALFLVVLLIKQRRWAWRMPNQFLFGVLLIGANGTVGVIMVLLGLGVISK